MGLSSPYTLQLEKQKNKQMQRIQKQTKRLLMMKEQQHEFVTFGEICK